MKKTGERVIEKEYIQSPNEYFIYLCHIVTYNFAIPYVKNKDVLEFGSGSGYGSHLIAPSCNNLTAVDISKEAIDYSKSHYSQDNLKFQVIGDINEEQLPFDNDSFDVVISFQVIEHLKNVDVYTDELYRVLKPGGKIIVVTPDRKTRLFKYQKPWNMYHIKEFDSNDLEEIIGRKFKIEKKLIMSAREDLLKMEISRTKKMRVILLPFTMPFIPEFIRRNMISLIKKINSRKPERSDIEYKYNFDESDIYINEDKDNSINLFIIAQK